MVAMSIGESFSRLLLKRLVDDVFIAGGFEALDAVVDFLTRCGERNDPRLAAALLCAMQRAWSALEAALGDRPSRASNEAGLSPRDAQTLRRCLGRVFDELACGRGVVEGSMRLDVALALRRRCRSEVRCADAAGALAGCLDSEEWARSNEIFVRFAAEQGRIETRRRTEAQFLRDLEEYGCVGLMRLLTGGCGLPLLLLAGRAFICQELAHLLYRCLQECPEQTPNQCSLVLEILHELSCPRFSVWRSAAHVAAPAKAVHWSRLESRAGRARRDPPRPSGGSRNEPHPTRRIPWQRIGRVRKKPHSFGGMPRPSWMLIAVLTLAAALLIVLPLGMLVEHARQKNGERQRLAVQQQRGGDERRRAAEERQRQIDEQRRLVREEALQRQARQRQRQEAERRRRIEAEEERQRAEEVAERRRSEERRRLAEEQLERRRAAERRRERAKAALDDGLTHSALRRDEKALACLTEAIRLDPTLDRAYGARAEVRRRLNDVAGALVDFHVVVRRNPDDVAAWSACGELHARRREDSQALDAFNAIVRLQPKNADAYRHRGLCYQRLDEVEKALADLNQAIALSPNDPQAYLHRAELHRQRNELARAFDDYTAALDRKRGDERGLAPAYRGRGILQAHWGLYEHAIRDLTRALDLDATDTEALRARAAAYLRNGEWTNALLDAESLLRHDGESLTAYKLRGQAYMGSGEYQRAHDDFSRVLRGGRDAETFYLRARTKVHLGDLQEAIYDCNDATSINPRLAGAFYLRGKLNLRAGYRVSGLDDCRTAHALDSHYPLP
jgi:tetratricopeptide (TPR) repeat protein